MMHAARILSRIHNYTMQRQERYETVRITEGTDIGTYLNTQLANHVEGVTKSLGIKSGAKWKNIRHIQDIMTKSGITGAVKPLSVQHMKCLEEVAASGGLVKRHIPEKQTGGDAEILQELYRMGFLMLGVKTIRGRRYKVAAIPADVLRCMVRLGLLRIPARLACSPQGKKPPELCSAAGRVPSFGPRATDVQRRFPVQGRRPQMSIRAAVWDM